MHLPVLDPIRPAGKPTEPLSGVTLAEFHELVEVEQPSEAPIRGAQSALLPDGIRCKAQREIGWLIEGEDREGETIYYGLRTGDDSYWTKNVNRALRFARAQDARCFAGLFLTDDEMQMCRVTEHFWD